MLDAKFEVMEKMFEAKIEKILNNAFASMVDNEAYVEEDGMTFCCSFTETKNGIICRVDIVSHYVMFESNYGYQDMIKKIVNFINQDNLARG